MKIKCEYCGAYIEDTEENCPNCGAVNQHLQRQATGVPRTIEELKEWYQKQNLPPEEVTRFFIGKNYTKAKAFGIYQEEDGNFVVYKNKANSVRVIRYRGKDEAYAVNELYMRLKEEIINQREHNLNKTTGNRSNTKTPKSAIICITVFVIVFALMIIISVTRPSRGYYYYDDNYYYYLSGTWYEYDDYSGWYKTSAPSDLKDSASDYYESINYSGDYGVENFTNTDFYSDWEDSKSSSSSSSSSSSWDSSSTDWDSDW